MISKEAAFIILIAIIVIVLLTVKLIETGCELTRMRICERQKDHRLKEIERLEVSYLTDISKLKCNLKMTTDMVKVLIDLMRDLDKEKEDEEVKSL